MTHTQDSSTRLRPSYHINSKPYTATATSTTLFEDNSDIDLDKSICEQLKIKVCASTSCSKKRKILGMDEFATFGGVYERAGTSGVSVEESTCLGKCKMAPCVAVEHEDYIGNIGLEGMTDSELSSSMFFGYVFVLSHQIPMQDYFEHFLFYCLTFYDKLFYILKCHNRR